MNHKRAKSKGVYIISIIILIAIIVSIFFKFLNYIKFLDSEPLLISYTLKTANILTKQPKPLKILATSTKSTLPIKSPLPAKPTTTPEVLSQKNIKLEVPFASQAPFGEWSDLRQQNACEEVAAIMAIRWANKQTLTPQEAKEEIIAISDWEQEEYGYYQDTSAQDTADRIFKEYFNYQKVKVINNISIQDIINELQKGNLVIAPMDGQKLGNPFFSPPGPVEHMVVIIGYDFQTKEFITNDSGTKRGQNYRYKQNILFEAIRDYPSGNHKPIIGINKNIIIVEK